MAASFYSSPLIGATTTLACFAHEIPHEIADYSILVRSGFTKRQAMQSQFLTAVGAFVSHFLLPSLVLRHGQSTPMTTSLSMVEPKNWLTDSYSACVFISTATWNLRSGEFLCIRFSVISFLISRLALLHHHTKNPPNFTVSPPCRTFMGIGIHNLSSSGDVSSESSDLTAAIRQTASGILGTTVQLADLVSPSSSSSSPRCMDI